MTKWKIMGMCENCGFCYKGEIEAETTYFPDILCPKCGEGTQNFDEEAAVKALNKAEKTNFDYHESTFKYAKS